MRDVAPAKTASDRPAPAKPGGHVGQAFCPPVRAASQPRLTVKFAPAAPLSGRCPTLAVHLVHSVHLVHPTPPPKMPNEPQKAINPNRA